MRRKRFVGHRPKLDSGFYYVMKYTKWFIYAKEDGEGYVNFKFVYNGRKRGKANYSFCYMRQEDRFTNKADTARFMSDFPEGIVQLILTIARTFTFRGEYYASEI